MKKPGGAAPGFLPAWPLLLGGGFFRVSLRLFIGGGLLGLGLPLGGGGLFLRLALGGGGFLLRLLLRGLLVALGLALFVRLLRLRAEHLLHLARGGRRSRRRGFGRLGLLCGFSGLRGLGEHGADECQRDCGCDEFVHFLLLFKWVRDSPWPNN